MQINSRKWSNRIYSEIREKENYFYQLRGKEKQFFDQNWLKQQIEKREKREKREKGKEEWREKGKEYLVSEIEGKYWVDKKGRKERS